jgi:hypothetical protein
VSNNSIKLRNLEKDLIRNVVTWLERPVYPEHCLPDEVGRDENGKYHLPLLLLLVLKLDRHQTVVHLGHLQGSPIHDKIPKIIHARGA